MAYDARGDHGHGGGGGGGGHEGSFMRARGRRMFLVSHIHFCFPLPQYFIPRSLIIAIVVVIIKCLSIDPSSCRFTKHGENRSCH